MRGNLFFSFRWTRRVTLTAKDTGGIDFQALVGVGEAPRFCSIKHPQTLHGIHDYIDPQNHPWPFLGSPDWQSQTDVVFGMAPELVRRLASCCLTRLLWDVQTRQITPPCGAGRQTAQGWKQRPTRTAIRSRGPKAVTDGEEKGQNMARRSASLRIKDPTLSSVKVWFGSCRAPCGTCRVRSPSSSVQ